MYSLLRPLLFSLSPESAHSFSLSALRILTSSTLSRLFLQPIPEYPRDVMGLRFKNPIGLAAGLDKNGEYVDALGRLGFGFIEIGTVTPRPQPGNPEPRLFRLPEAHALINRMGFNNVGVDALVENIQNRKYDGILGISVGKNADTSIENALDDYLQCMRKVYTCADYIAVNISSPNTKNLRNLQQERDLTPLLSALKAEQKKLKSKYRKYVPLVVKIAPDLDKAEVELIARIVEELEIDGIIATNTTISRKSVTDLPHGDETGGLSGEPLRASSTKVVKQLHGILKDRVPIIGSGGVMSGEDALDKRQAGASLVQLYTGLIYRGPGLVKEAVDALRESS